VRTAGYTKVEYRDARGKIVCFGAAPPYRPNIRKGTLDSEFGGVPVKLRWDRLTDTVASILLLSESAVEEVKKMPGFEPE
jgi:hypothetical protein